MEVEQSHISGEIENESYLRIWEAEQDYNRTRWTVTTFFLSVSFAIFGFSFQNLTKPTPTVVRLSGLIVYLFAYLLFLRLNHFSNFLREQLKALEKAKRTTLEIQTKANEVMLGGWRKFATATHLLFLLGVIYVGGVIWLWSQGL